MIYGNTKVIDTQIALVKRADKLEEKVKALTDRLEQLIKWQRTSPKKSYMESY